MGSCDSRSGEAASGDLGGLSGCAERGQGEVRPALENRWKVGIPASPKTVRRTRLDAKIVLRGAVAWGSADDGQVVYRFKRAWRDGTHAVVLSAADFIASVPP